MVVDLDQTVGLQRFEGAEVQVVQVRGQGLGEGEAVQGLAFERAGTAENRGDAFADGRGQRDRAAPGPLIGAGDGGQQPAHRPEQVAQQPQVAPAQAAQPLRGERVERAGAGGEQPAGLLLGQRLQRQARQEFAGPQPGDRAGHRRAVRGDDQQPGAPVHGELVDEGSGGVVEQVRVVHQQRADTGQQPDRAVQRDRLRQQMGERREGDGPALGRTGRPGAVGAADRLGDEAGLAAARRARHHDAAPQAGQRPSDQFQFVLPPGERPGQLQRRRVPLVSHHTDMSAATHL